MFATMRIARAVRMLESQTATEDHTMSDHSALDAFIAGLGINYGWQFVTQSSSRNAAESQPTLNWAITLQTNRNCSPLQTAYTQGIAHVPGYNQTKHSCDRRVLEKSAHTGKYPRVDSRGMVPFYNVVQTQKPLPPPTLRDVLHSLVSDAGAIDHASFEDWAAECGYETDSRKAEAIYQDCLRIGLQLRAMIGNANLEQLRTLFQDY